MQSPQSRAWSTVLALASLAPSAAHAYLDPGSGSYVLQILLAGVVAGLFGLKLFWARLVGLFGQLTSRRPPQSDDD